MLERLLDRPKTIVCTTPLAEVLQFFSTNKEVQVVPIIDERGYPLGILRERDLKGYVYSSFGREVLLNKSLKRSLDEFIHRCPVCDVNTQIDRVLELFGREEEEDGVIVTKERLYEGFLTTASMMKILYEQSLIEKNKESIDSLVVGVAHEMNTPIGICVTAASMISDHVEKIEKKMEQGALKKSDFKEFIDFLKEADKVLLPNLQRAASLVQSFKQISVNRIDERPVLTEVCAFFSQVVRSALSGHPHLVVSVEVDARECGSVPLYVESMREVLHSLCQNALVHGFHKRKKGSVRVVIDHEGEYLKITFSDDGVGMEEPIRQKIFEPFFTTKRGSYSGLGLHIVQSIVVHRMRGAIECSSAPDEGTTFEIAIPLLPPL